MINNDKQDIAMIGMACRFPQAPSIDHFWQLLISETHAISTMKTNRFGFEDVHADLRRGGLMEDDIDATEYFDARFFSISSREAAMMDPQQKIMLEVSWRALQDAGIADKTPTLSKKLANTQTGVFIGVMNSDWGKISFSDKNNIEVYHGTGNGYCMIANRLSYVYNLRGPSIAIDTACSSSLVAIDVASRYLMTHDIDTAIVGGVNLMLTPMLSVFYQKAGLLSQVGQCQSFGSFADGIVRGEGAGVIVLKRLSDAIQDNHKIYAVIKGSAVNQDGLSNGITAPNRGSQINVITRALKKSHVHPKDIQYVEAHGTGTLMGDPIEISALTEAIARHKKSPLYVGSVKSNMGHLEGAAGIAGIIKTALSMHHQQIPPSLHADIGNPFIDFKKSNVTVTKTLTPWSERIRRAGVSAFGLGGTNAHVVLESYDRDTIESLIAMIAAVSEIPVEKIQYTSDFINALGFDSIMIIDLKNTIEKKLGIEGKLILKNVVQLKTVGELIAHIYLILQENNND